MKIKIDSFVTVSNLKDATAKAPKMVKILGVKFIEAEFLPFKSEEGRYELEVEIDGDKLDWMPNKTSLRTITAKYGDESDAWVGKEVGLFALTQNVSGEMKDVVYAGF